MIPKGVWLDSFCVLLGTNAGVLFSKWIPKKLEEPLFFIFGMCAIAIGLVSVIKVSSLPAVILALILGTVIGVLLDLDRKIKKGFLCMMHRTKLQQKEFSEEYMEFYLMVAMTLCASGTNIFGAMQEGATGDMSILLSKAVMDIFAAAIFGMSLGYAMNFIVPVQCIFLSIYFYVGKFCFAMLSEEILFDFVAVGGLMTLILGFNIAKIKKVQVANLLPALFCVFPISAIFLHFM